MIVTQKIKLEGLERFKHFEQNKKKKKKMMTLFVREKPANPSSPVNKYRLGRRAVFITVQVVKGRRWYRGGVE